MKKVIIFAILSIILIPIIGILGNVLEFSGELMAILLVVNITTSLVLLLLWLNNQIDEVCANEKEKHSSYVSKYGDYYDYLDL